MVGVGRGWSPLFYVRPDASTSAGNRKHVKRLASNEPDANKETNHKRQPIPVTRMYVPGILHRCIRTYLVWSSIVGLDASPRCVAILCMGFYGVYAVLCPLSYDINHTGMYSYLKSNPRSRLKQLASYIRGYSVQTHLN